MRARKTLLFNVLLLGCVYIITRAPLFIRWFKLVDKTTSTSEVLTKKLNHSIIHLNSGTSNSFSIHNPSDYNLSDYNKGPKIRNASKDILDLDPDEVILGPRAQIPHILHQAWLNNYTNNNSVPEYFKDKVISWTELHPKWEYWFWQDIDVQLLLKLCFPGYYKLYQIYPDNVNRADIMRYFVLFTFGGLYVDLDMEALKPNDALLDDAPCVLTQETHVHSVLLYNRLKFPNLINAYMASRPRHPLFKMAIEDLPRSRYFINVLRRTGPLHLDNIYQVYNQTSFHSPVGKWHRPADDVKILQPKLVMPTYDSHIDSYLHQKCMLIMNRDPYYSEVCKIFFKRRTMNNQPYPESFANHLWTHTYVDEEKWRSGPGLPIKDIVPHVVNVTERIIEICDGLTAGAS